MHVLALLLVNNAKVVQYSSSVNYYSIALPYKSGIL